MTHHGVMVIEWHTWTEEKQARAEIVFYDKDMPGKREQWECALDLQGRDPYPVQEAALKMVLDKGLQVMAERVRK